MGATVPAKGQGKGMDDNTATIQRLLTLPENDLYLEIGQHLSGKPAFPLPPRQLIEVARSWCHDKLAKTVCTTEQLRLLAKQDVPTQELILSVCGVLDVVSHVLGSVPAITAAALIVRVGLHKFCGTIWASACQSEKTNG